MRLVRGKLAHLAVEAAVVREMDRVTVLEYGLPGAVLMENAALAATQLAAEMLSGNVRVLVLAGAGNNAGDGFAVARHLANRGVEVEVVTAGQITRYRADAAVNLAVIAKMGLSIRLWGRDISDLSGDYDLVVDALLGTGLSGPLRPPYGEMIDAVNRLGRTVLAIDIPSGLDADTGQAPGAVVKARTTITFALPKTGLYRGVGPDASGEIVLGDIEMPRAVYPEGKLPEPR